jgi:hypothetical protein
MTSSGRVEFLQDQTHFLVAILVSQKSFHGRRIFLLAVVALQGAVMRIQYLRHNATKFHNASVILAGE